MYSFQLTAVLTNSGAAIQRMTVVAASLSEAMEIATRRLWWDCYSDEEFALNFTGKTRI